MNSSNQITNFSQPMRNLVALMIFLLLVGLALGYSVFWDRQEQERLTAGPVNPPLSQIDVSEAIAAVRASGYITEELPSRFFLVTNPAAFTSLKAARPGDQILIYSQAKMAVLYDPITHKLITAAPVAP